MSTTSHLLAWLLTAFGRGRAARAPGEARFRLMYARFREILSLNELTLSLIADLEEALAGVSRCSAAALRERIRRCAMDVFVMVKDLNQIAGGAYPGLYDALASVSGRLEDCLVGQGPADCGPLVLPLGDLRIADVGLAGGKMARLGEVSAACHLPVPAGFVITTVATARLLTEGGVWGRCERLESVLELEGTHALAEACEEVRAAVLGCVWPPDVVAAVAAARRDCLSDPDAAVAVRSSAATEDEPRHSHAGVYSSELNVPAADCLDAARRVVASAFSPNAVCYRRERGIATRDAVMAVGVLRMVEARCAGVAYSRPPEAPQIDAVVVAATAGTADRLVAGEVQAEHFSVVPGQEGAAAAVSLDGDELARLVGVARRLEQHFGGPQDLEWALDPGGCLVVLQTRALVVGQEEPPVAVPVADADVLVAGGHSACSGVGSGPVVLITAEADLDRFPDGGVLVARHSSPTFARVMPRCAAIVTDVGSPVGHMASLAREYGIPAIVGLNGATRRLPAGRYVTVDAAAGRVLDGAILVHRPSRAPQAVQGAGRLAWLAAAARQVTPLHLTDPAAAEFCPESCRTLHDITRFVHEKSYEVMFHYGDLATADRRSSMALEARLPITVRVFDVGGGVRAGAGPRRIRPSDVTSVPLAAFLGGLLEPRIRWDLPRPVSVRGFLAVLGQNVAGPPAQALDVGRTSYAIVSDRYMNFSTKAGYHFSTVDCFCCDSQLKNYIHFRFAGGGADPERRSRRIRFLSTVLMALDFRVTSRSDLLTARLDKYESDVVAMRLAELGRLTLCARQLDMLMDNDASPDFFARAFLAADWGKF